MADGERRLGTESSFEANLRGKLKKGLRLNPSVDLSNASTNTVQNIVDTEETPQMQVDVEDPNNNNNGTDLDVNMEAEQPADPGVEIDNDTNEEGSPAPGLAPDVDSDEGRSADDRGYHHFTKIPSTVRMPTIVRHGEGKDWVRNHLPIPEGISSPEGYQWGRNPGELLWVELAQWVRKRASLSQIYVMDKKAVKLYKVNEDGTQESTPTIEGTCDDPYILKLCCGEPQLFPDILYNIDTRIIQLRGPERLDTYIPPSELPLWLYVYDEDNLTLYPEDDLTPADADWLALDHPLLPIPSSIKPLKYRLVDPSGKNVRDDDPPVDPEQDHATLILSKSRTMRTGRYCHLVEGQISLQNPNYPSRLRLVTKMSKHRLFTKYLENEGSMYSLFPESFSREYSGVQLVTPSHFPWCLSQVVPMFYGYYEHVEEPEDLNVGENGTPESESSNVVNGQEMEENEEDQNQVPEQVPRSPILLTEYCGEEIHPLELTQYQKLEIVSLVDRFHKAGFIHRAFSVHSIVAQPGPPERFEPLCRTPKWARTSKRPSFRLNGFENAWWVGLQSQKELFESTYGNVRQAFMTDKSKLGQKILMRMLV